MNCSADILLSFAAGGGEVKRDACLETAHRVSQGANLLYVGMWRPLAELMWKLLVQFSLLLFNQHSLRPDELLLLLHITEVSSSHLAQALLLLGIAHAGTKS
jgi:hypothetical protein